MAGRYANVETGRPESTDPYAEMKRHKSTVRRLAEKFSANVWVASLAFIFGCAGVAALVIACLAYLAILPPFTSCAKTQLTLLGVCANASYNPTIGSIFCKTGNRASFTVPPFTCTSFNSTFTTAPLSAVLPQAYQPDIDYGQLETYFVGVTHNYNATDSTERPLISFMTSCYNANGSAPCVNYIDTIAGAAGAPPKVLLFIGINPYGNAGILPNSATGQQGINYGLTLGPYQTRSSATIISMGMLPAMVALGIAAWNTGT